MGDDEVIEIFLRSYVRLLCKPFCQTHNCRRANPRGVGNVMSVSRMDLGFHLSFGEGGQE